jgi:hypothetical protein
MNSVVRIAYSDLAQRTRSFATLLVIAAVLELGYLFVPDAAANYSVVDFNGWRGMLGSTWIGAVTAILTATLPFFGFIVVRGALVRDARFGVAEIVAASPLPRPLFALGKWLSDFAFLAGLSALLVLAGVAMQFIRGEDRTLLPLGYLLPFLIVTLPACAVTAALAIVCDAWRPLRGIGGVLLMFAFWIGDLIWSMNVGGEPHATPQDAFGSATLLGGLIAGMHHVLPHVAVGNNVSIGVGDPSRHMFAAPPLAWSTALIVPRLLWTAAAVALAVCAGAFPAAIVTQRPRVRTALVARWVAVLPLGSLVRAELALAAGDAGTPWAIGAIVLAVAGFVAPRDAALHIVAPLAWIWPIGPLGVLATRERLAGFADIALATSLAAWRRAAARCAAAMILTTVPLLGVIAHGGPAVFAIALALAGCAMLGGALGMTAAAFQAIAVVVWYLGPVNSLPALDPAALAHDPLTLPCALLIVGMTFVATSVRLSRRG